VDKTTLPVVQTAQKLVRIKYNVCVLEIYKELEISIQSLHTCN